CLQKQAKGWMAAILHGRDGGCGRPRERERQALFSPACGLHDPGRRSRVGIEGSFAMNFDFAGKRVLVTGGTRGIGLAIVEAFLEAGARVAVNGRSEQTVGSAIARLSPLDGIVPAVGSMATVKGCRNAVEAATAGLSGLDVLVNNAGVWHPTPVAS